MDDPSKLGAFALLGDAGAVRSEEHTSELQSRLHLVCRLLLEKKKKNKDKKDQITSPWNPLKQACNLVMHTDRTNHRTRPHTNTHKMSETLPIATHTLTAYCEH